MTFVSRYLDPVLVERLNHLQLSARRVVEGTISGRYRGPVRGASVEFRQHRPYVIGDEPRRLDWRVLARTDRPFVREYDQETNLRALIVLDASGSMKYGRGGGGQSKLDYAARLTASLAYLMLGETESVGLMTTGAGGEQYLAPHAGTQQLARVIDLLERTAAAGASDLRGALQQAAQRIGRRSLVLVLSDFLQPLGQVQEALSRVAHDRHEIIVLRILHRDELEFPFRTWTRFVGTEGEHARLCEPAMVRARYLASFDRHARGLERACRSVQAELHTLVTDVPLADAIVNLLGRRTSWARR